MHHILHMRNVQQRQEVARWRKTEKAARVPPSPRRALTAQISSDTTNASWTGGFSAGCKGAPPLAVGSGGSPAGSPTAGGMSTAMATRADGIGSRPGAKGLEVTASALARLTLVANDLLISERLTV